MIAGHVTPNREAVIQLPISNGAGKTTDIDGVIDTGFSGWLTLPPAVIASLGLKWRRRTRAILADGSELYTDLYEGAVLWDSRAITVSILEADADPLVGMCLMYGYELLIPVIDGGAVRLTRI